MKMLLHNRPDASVLRKGARAQRNFGFTIIELMIVVAIILILVGIAALNYQKTVIRSKEAVLRTNLKTIRDAIDNFTLDKQAAPQSVDDLAQAGYLHGVPVDPMTRAKDWVPVFDSVVISPEQTTTGMTDVHSNSNGVSPFENTPYNEW